MVGTMTPDKQFLEETLGSPEKWGKLVLHSTVGGVPVSVCPYCKALTIDGPQHKAWHIDEVTRLS